MMPHPFLASHLRLHAMAKALGVEIEILDAEGTSARLTDAYDGAHLYTVNYAADLDRILIGWLCRLYQVRASAWAHATDPPIPWDLSLSGLHG